MLDFQVARARYVPFPASGSLAPPLPQPLHCTLLGMQALIACHASSWLAKCLIPPWWHLKSSPCCSHSRAGHHHSALDGARIHNVGWPPCSVWGCLLGPNEEPLQGVCSSLRHLLHTNQPGPWAKVRAHLRAGASSCGSSRQHCHLAQHPSLLVGLHCTLGGCWWWGGR